MKAVKVKEFLEKVFTPIFLGGLALAVGGGLVGTIIGLVLIGFDLYMTFKKDTKEDV